MADQDFHATTKTPSSPNFTPISDTLADVEMKAGGAYTVHVNSQNDRPCQVIATEKDLINIPTKGGNFDGSATAHTRHEMPSEWGWNDREPTPLPQMTKPERLRERTQETSSTSSVGIAPSKKDEIESKMRSQNGRKLEETGIRISQLEKELVQATKTASQFEKQLLGVITKLSKVENQLLHNNNSLLTTEANLRASQLECKTLRLKLEDALENLRQTQEHVFRLQPKQQGITQNDALAAYTSICNTVESWIGFHLDSALNEGRIDLSTLDKNSASKLIKLLTPSGRKGTQYVDTDEYNLIAVVMEFLRCQIFEKDFYGALEAKHLELVGLAIRNMESLRPRRDLENCRSWRSETFGALVNSPDFDLRQKTRIQVLANELLQILGLIDVSILNEKCFGSLAINVIEPAVHLAHQLHLSIDQFRVQWSQDDQLASPQRSRDLSTLENYDCINLLGNGKAVKFEGRENVSRDVPYLFDIVPGFYSQTFKGDCVSDLRVLRKPKVLVAVSKSGRNGSQIIPLAGKSGTILGCIYDKMRLSNA